MLLVALPYTVCTERHFNNAAAAGSVATLQLYVIIHCFPDTERFTAAPTYAMHCIAWVTWCIYLMHTLMRSLQLRHM